MSSNCNEKELEMSDIETESLEDYYVVEANEISEILQMNSEMEIKKETPEGLDGQGKAEIQSLQDQLRYETFTMKERKQMENDVTFDWEEDVNDPFEKAMATSREDKEDSEIHKEHVRTYGGDGQGQSNGCRLRDRIVEAELFYKHKPQNKSILLSQGYSGTNRGDNQSQTNGHKLQDHITEVRSFEDSKTKKKSVLHYHEQRITCNGYQCHCNGQRLKDFIPEIGHFQDLEPQNEVFDVSQGHSRAYSGDDQVQKNGQRLQDHIPEYYQDHELQIKRVLLPQEHRRTLEDNQGRSNCYRLQSLIQKDGSFQDHKPENKSVSHSQGHSTTYKGDGQDQNDSHRLQDNIPEVGYCQDSKPLNESLEFAQASSRSYKRDNQGQNNGQILQDHIPAVRYCQDSEPLSESNNAHVSDSTEYKEDHYKRNERSYNSSLNRGRGRGRQPQRLSNDSSEKYSPKDVCNSREERERNGCYDVDCTVSQEGSFKGQHSKSSTFSPNRGYNRGTLQEPHRSSGISFETHSHIGIRNRQAVGIKPWLLVEALAEFPDFKATLLQLLEYKNMEPSAVRQVELSNGHIIRIDGEVVKLHPKIRICKAHSGPQGCQNPLCTELHICDTYVASWCQESNCMAGHRWYTDHNKAVLQNFSLERLPHQSLRNLIRSSMIVTGPKGQLDVCHNYNGKGCSERDCDSLHVCLSIVVGQTRCFIPGCKLNHNLLTSDCCKLLRGHGLSTNEAPRDVAMALLAAYPAILSGGTIKQTTLPTQATSTSDQVQKTPTAVDKQQDAEGAGNSRIDGSMLSRLTQRTASLTLEMPMSPGASAVRSRHSLDDNRNSNFPKRKDESVPKKKNGTDKTARINERDDRVMSTSKSILGKKDKKCQTVWSHHLRGDTEIDQICFHSVESSCKYEKIGCCRLHAAQHFHWQISEQGDSWLNLRSFQVDCLERSFCIPDQDGVFIPPLDPTRLHSSVHHLFTVLGPDTWYANFQAMIMNNKDYTKILYLRRLCTDVIAGQKIKASSFRWFFKDRNQKWVLYGNVDTTGETKLVSSVTSDDIEKHFLQDQNTPLTFKNANYMYVLDFRTMTQVNKSTNVKRAVCRRPEPHLQDTNQARGKRALNKTHSR